MTRDAIRCQVLFVSREPGDLTPTLGRLPVESNTDITVLTALDARRYTGVKLHAVMYNSHCVTRTQKNSGSSASKKLYAPSDDKSVPFPRRELESQLVTSIDELQRC